MKKSLFTAVAVWLGLTASLMAQVPSYVPTNGLVGWWPFNGNANDESGNGNNGTVNGATLTVDRFGNPNKAFRFNGINNEIVVANDNTLDLTNEGTFLVWTKVNQINFDSESNSYNARLIDKITPGGVDGYLIDLVNFNSSICTNNSIRVRNIFDNTLNYSECYSDFMDWRQIIVTFLNGSVKVYINGVLFASHANTSFNIPINDLPLVFGHQNTGQNTGQNTNWLNGELDDIGIWNRALSQQEISNLYNSSNCSNDLTISPILNTQNIGGNATFTATTSESNPTYSWQSDLGQGFQTLNNYGNYSGANTNTLTISNVQLANHNQQIRAISTSGNCVTTSNIATIQIADTCITNVTVYDTLLTTVTDTLVINTTLSLPAPNNENTILIYPNPAIDHITIDNGNFTAMAGYSIKIENNAGQQVFQSAINQQQFYVDLSTWSGNGLYFVHLIDSQNNTVTVRKIVLQ